ncbi:14219_t:CDS:2 [Funneliformis caledonium]|uniref:14219_t:CDS:1 n=1 Tax=Funneliformis caledonium TaxID=1117310 RepID=A0A9N8Z8V5_9GLOM|nr:14219_t:CDS:2 [Funneliformis caledonium]
MDPDTLKTAAANIQREEQRATGQTPAGGVAARAQSLADRAAKGQPMTQTKPKEQQNIDKVNVEDVKEAASILNREESKLYGGVNPPDTAASHAQSFANKIRQEKERTE